MKFGFGKWGGKGRWPVLAFALSLSACVSEDKEPENPVVIEPAPPCSTFQCDSIVLMSILKQVGKYFPYSFPKNRTGRIDSMTFSNVDTLSPEIGRLTGLKWLRISTVDLDGGLSVLPKEIGRLTLLETFIWNSYRAHSIPREIGELRSLRTVTLELALGTLPAEVGNWVHLDTIHFIKTRLTNLPGTIGNWRDLRYFHYGPGPLRALPQEVGEWARLRQFSMYDTDLEILPDGIGKMDSMASLVCLESKVTTLPRSMGGMDSLRNIQMSGNRIRSLPSDIGSLERLQSADFSRNDMDSLPAGITSLRAQFFRLDSNRLCDVPSTLNTWLDLKSRGWRTTQRCTVE